MAQFCVDKNISTLRQTFERGLLFTESLETSAFCTVLEIIWNICRGKHECVKCFSKKTIKKLKSKRADVRVLLDKKKSTKKRRKKFLKSKKGFQKLVKEILKQFFEHCTEEVEEL